MTSQGNTSRPVFVCLFVQQNLPLSLQQNNQTQTQKTKKETANHTHWMFHRDDLKIKKTTTSWTDEKISNVGVAMHKSLWF